ncbi:aegerolysin family protein [Paenibacillus sp. JX-17]|uniref:Aegerolysin family protein n=1 Tax=Paenibacillus lacisoli TaxID=3064525 RepID=A0ABT9CEB3_9BACL|nr:aegerolysin family protein [Paenibacillus sp. JX-17]MDO7907605.1 aegerolysin family protein [Paenibacillus sp. JX-17]
MADTLWVELIIENYNSDVMIKNIELEWGRLYPFGHRDQELSKDQVEGKVIKAGENYWFCACGRSWSLSGTEGSFQLFDAQSGEYLGKYSWDIPMGETLNKSEWAKSGNTNYRFDFWAGNRNYYGDKQEWGRQIGRAHIRLWDASKPPYRRW